MRVGLAIRLGVVAVAGVVASAVVACGSDDAATVAAPAPAAGGDVPGSSTAGDVPAAEMIDVRTGAAVNLQSVVDGETPLLLWFWVPH